MVGDLHGDIVALESITDLVDFTKDYTIFLGDYADRGDSGVEVVESISSLIRENPETVIALKGNHEDFTESGNPTFYPCSLINEVKTKRGDWKSYYLSIIKPFLSNLYLAAAIPGLILFVHGGVSNRLSSLKDLRYPTRDIELDILWSDPFKGTGEYPNRRGVGVEFGFDISKSICKSLGVNRIIRSHQPNKALDGPCYEHDNRIITISSTRVYSGKPFILIINPADFTNLSHHFL